jgi:putative ABC transport system permease protein
MLSAIGMTRRQVRRMVRHESIMTALLGASTGVVAGLGLGWIAAQLLSDEGLTFAVPGGTLVVIAIVAIIAGILAAILPARRAARLSPLTALAYE